MNYETCMKTALQLARRGAGWTAPNPMVGAVIVKNDRVIAEGWHRRCGDPHAEREALNNCRESCRGATLYVTLEPCCHEGRQPPCTDAILQSGIREVVIVCPDPNPQVSGNGIRILREHGITVRTGVLEQECLAPNQAFFHWIRTGLPFIALKYAMTLDGKTEAASGNSKWITGEETRAYVHRLRHEYTGILAGIGTVLKDDLMLNCRLPETRNPVRIVCDTNLSMPLNCSLVRSATRCPLIIATCVTDKNRLAAYERAGCRILTCRRKHGHADLRDLMCRLGKMEISSILVEGGSFAASLLEEHLVNRVVACIAPWLFGGELSKSPIGGSGVFNPAEGVVLRNTKMMQMGTDYVIEGDI